MIFAGEWKSFVRTVRIGRIANADLEPWDPEADELQRRDLSR